MDQVFDDIARMLASIRLGHPLRVGIDGRTAAGKSTFAAHLAGRLKSLDRAVIATSVDAFHNPKAQRYRQGRESAIGYFDDARNLDALRSELLQPLGPDGSLRYRTACFDLENDLPIEGGWRRAGADDILVVDGTFLAKAELSGLWDFFIFLDVSAGTAKERARIRSLPAGADAAGSDLYATRYMGAWDIYLSRADPMARADLVLNMENPEKPVICLR